MIKEQKKLEEIMYLSLIGKFENVILFGDNKHFCFTSQTNNKFAFKPTYVTNEKIASDNVALLRLQAFEKKVYNKDYYEKLLKTAKNKPNFAKRIKMFLENVNQQNLTVRYETRLYYETNLLHLFNNQIIDEDSYYAAKEYIAGQIKGKQQSLEK